MKISSLQADFCTKGFEDAALLLSRLVPVCLDNAAKKRSVWEAYVTRKLGVDGHLAQRLSHMCVGEKEVRLNLAYAFYKQALKGMQANLKICAVLVKRA